MHQKTAGGKVAIPFSPPLKTGITKMGGDDAVEFGSGTRRKRAK